MNESGSNQEVLNKSTYPQRLVELLDVLESEFKHKGDDKTQAKLNAEIAVKGIAYLFGGKIIYLPKGKKLDDAIRHKRIYEAYKAGADIDYLVEQSGYSTQYIYRLIKKQRELHRKKAIGETKASPASGSKGGAS